MGLISGLGRCPGERNGNPLSVLVWEIPWTEKPGRLQSMESQKSQTQQNTNRMGQDAVYEPWRIG